MPILLFKCDKIIGIIRWNYLDSSYCGQLNSKGCFLKKERFSDLSENITQPFLDHFFDRFFRFQLAKRILVIFLGYRAYWWYGNLNTLCRLLLKRIRLTELREELISNQIDLLQTLNDFSSPLSVWCVLLRHMVPNITKERKTSWRSSKERHFNFSYLALLSTSLYCYFSIQGLQVRIHTFN